MQNIRVTIFQVDQVWEDKSANYSLYNTLFEKMIDSDLVLLPELFHTGFSMNSHQLAEAWEKSEGVNFLKFWANKRNTAIYTSLMIKDDGKNYNRGVFVFPNGDVSYYDKRKLFTLSGEDQHYSPGQKEKIVSYLGWNINLQICYDLRFPELCRNHIIYGKPAYDLLLYVANWPEKRIEHWTTLLKARAIENQAYIIGANRIGLDGKDLFYSGGSSICDPNGNTMELKSESKEIQSVILSIEDLNIIRKNLPFLKDQD
jgi:omega-amidase